MSTRQIHVFISHSWSYSGHYDTLAKWIFGTNWSVGQASLDLRDFSVPRTDPIENTTNDKQLREAIYAQLRRTHIVVIPTGMYAHYSKWIGKEIDGAKAYNRPIVAVNPWGQLRSASVVASAADKMVGWNSQPLINAIWELYRDTYT